MLSNLILTTQTTANKTHTAITIYIKEFDSSPVFGKSLSLIFSLLELLVTLLFTKFAVPLFWVLFPALFVFPPFCPFWLLPFPDVEPDPAPFPPWLEPPPWLVLPLFPLPLPSLPLPLPLPISRLILSLFYCYLNRAIRSWYIWCSSWTWEIS